MRRAYKITPVSLYDVRGLESWLEDMARRGLFLKKLRPTLSVFARGQVQFLRYRVEPCRRIMDDAPPQAMLDLYQDFGWTFVCDTPELLIFSTENPEAPEPHSDPELQGVLWKKLYRSKRRLFLFELVMFLAAAAFTPYLLFGKGTPVLALLTTSASVLLAYLPFFLIVICGEWTDLRRLALIVQQLEEGVPLDHRSVYPRRRWGEMATLVIAVLLFAALVIVQNILPLTGGGARPLDELTAFVPLSLADVEGEGFTPHTFVMNGRDYSNFCAVDHYLLCRDQWEVVQTGSIHPDDRHRLEIQWYDLPGWLSPLSAPLARELLDKTMGLHQDIWWTDEGRDRVWTVQYYPREDASLLATANNGPGGFQIAAVSQGSRAAVVMYTGNGDLAGHLDEIMSMVQ